MFGILFLAACGLVTSHEALGPPNLPIEAKATLLKYAAENGIKSADHVTPIYRRDLESDYAAYWQMVTDKGDYLVISSGAKTADHRVVMEGKLPTPTDLLIKRAKSLGNECAKFFMFAPGGIMMCENEAGRISATSHDLFIQPQGRDDTFHERHTFLETKQDVLRHHWKHVSGNVTADGVWKTSGVHSQVQNQASAMEEGIYPGESVFIPLDSAFDVAIKYIPKDPKNLDAGQKMLCDILKLCNANDSFTVNKSKCQVSPLGIHVVEIKPRMPGYPLVENEVSFQVEVLLQNGSVHVRRFGLDLRKRDRRQTQLPTMSILDESYFPEYDQHMLSDRHCYVGCGPVSWAMIFGYFDRRSHGNPKKYGTQAQALWRCGPTGNEANNTCVAPSRNTDTLKRYTEHLNGIMGTFCIGDQGATPQWKMDDVVDYFKDRMQGANPIIEEHHDWLLSDVGLYEDKFRTNMMDFVKSGWPTVVGIRVDGVFSQHYPVASRYRQHTTRTRSCIHPATGTTETGSCAKWRSATEFDMYLHMGWGGSQNGWRKAGMFFAAAAKYDLPAAS